MKKLLKQINELEKVNPNIRNINLTHHGINYECTREEALKFCAYIDNLLKDVEKSEKVG